MKTLTDSTAMILAAGLGTRLRHLTSCRPKALVPLAGKPLLQHVIEKLRSDGFRHVVINVHHFGEQIIDFVHNHDFGMQIDISDERQLLMDTGGGIVQATPLFYNSQVVMAHNVDIISDVDLNALCRGFQSSYDDAWLLTQDRDTSRKLLFDDEDRLIGWKNSVTGEYKWVGDPIDNYHERAFSGMHFFRPTLFAEFELQPVSVIDLYLKLAAAKSIRSVAISPNYWFDLGKPDQLRKAEDQLKDLGYER